MELQKTFTAVASLLLLAANVVVVPALAQTFPNKPVTLMVPYPAGGTSDVLARKISTPLAKALGQAVVVENLGGAGGAIAASKVLGAPSDGYMLYQGSPNELILAPLANAAVKYKSDEFRLVHNVGVFSMAIFARPDFPAASADELAAYAVKTAQAGKPMTYASVGYGSFYHMLGEQMSKVLNVPMTHVPYKGAGNILPDLIGSQIDIFISPYAAPHIEMVKAGKLKIVTAISPKRQTPIPNVPTVDEGKALKGFHYNIGTGYYVKKDTPEAVVQVLHKAIIAGLADADVRAAIAGAGGEPAPSTPLDQSARAYASEIAQFTAIAKSINLQPQ